MVFFFSMSLALTFLFTGATPFWKAVVLLIAGLSLVFQFATPGAVPGLVPYLMQIALAICLILYFKCHGIRR